MKFFKISLLLLIFCACNTNKEESSKYSNDFYIYQLLDEEISYTNNILKNQIENKLNQGNSLNNKGLKTYDKLTKEYLNYLEKTISELENSVKSAVSQEKYFDEINKSSYVNNYFFSNNDYSQKGSEFISKTTKYRNQISLLIKDENFLKKLEVTLGTENFFDQNGNLIKHLNAMYLDQPLRGILTRLKYKQKNVLELEYEFLNNLASK
ncbi:hypothetical protein [Aureivirga sp. CE67]|uniref:hypothetical protein n=1 Tax=Aureivirga sp. CE67 TaxID=1788983 RepID=UPI0018C8E653|nr:hypothetical protein [Aureivirga sp. CE67]